MTEELVLEKTEKELLEKQEGKPGERGGIGDSKGKNL